MNTLAYTPFIDALPLHDIWYLLIVPMSFFLALGYKAVRVPDLRQVPKATIVFTIQILGGIGVLAVVLTVLINYIIPMLAPMPS